MANNGGDWLGAVGSLSGGLMNGIFSMAGAQQNAQAIKEANDKSLAYSDFYNKNKLQIMADDARKAGLSPYAVTGSASGSMSPTFTANTAMGDGLSKVGDAMQNALVNATFDKIDNNTKMDELEVQKAELEIQEMKQRIAKEKASFDTSGGSGSGVNSSAEDYFTPYTMPDGTVQMKPNQNLTDLQSESTIEYVGGVLDNVFSPESQRQRYKEHLMKNNQFDPNTEVIYKYLFPTGWRFKKVPKSVGYWEALDYQPKSKKGDGDSKKGDKILKMEIVKEYKK